MIRVLSLCLAFFAAALPSLRAQDASPASDAARTFRVVALVGTFTELKFDHGGVTHHPRIARLPSAPLPIPANNQLVLYREIPPPADAPSGTPPVKEPVVRLAFPAGLKRALVFVAPVNGSGFVARVVDDDPNLSPADSIRVLNFCRNPAAIRVNQESRQLPPGENAVIPVPKGGTLVQLGVQTGESWEFAFRRELKFRPGFRHHMFIFEHMEDPDLLEPVIPPPPATVRLFHDAVLQN